MTWIEVTDTFQIYSVKDDFISVFDFILYFINSFFLYFLIGVSIILVFVVFFALARRLELFSKHFKRNDY